MKRLCPATVMTPCATFTEIVTRAAGTPALADQVWVLLTEAPNHGWVWACTRIRTPKWWPPRGRALARGDSSAGPRSPRRERRSICTVCLERPRIRVGEVLIPRSPWWTARRRFLPFARHQARPRSGTESPPITRRLDREEEAMAADTAVGLRPPALLARPVPVALARRLSMAGGLARDGRGNGDPAAKLRTTTSDVSTKVPATA
jgi:hypothetical protein